MKISKKLKTCSFILQYEFHVKSLFYLGFLWLHLNLTFVIVFCWSPECSSSRAISPPKASKVWKHLALTRVGLLFCSATSL